jgi:hypothetical protein
MDPLAAVEEQLGNVRAWPTAVIKDLFIMDPRTGGLKEAACFLYGNSISTTAAVNCVIACNGECPVNIKNKLFQWYFIWDRNPYLLHKAQYYSMHLKKEAWLNGRACSPYETVTSEIPVREFGFGEWPITIQACIDNVRSGRSNRWPINCGPMFV